MSLQPSTLAIMQAMAKPDAPGFAEVRLKQSPKTPQKTVAAKLADFGPSSPQVSQDCEGRSAFVEIAAPEVACIVDTGPLVEKYIKQGMQMAIDMMQATAAIQNGCDVPVASQFTGNRLP